MAHKQPNGIGVKTIRYDMFQNPSPNQNSTPTYHPRVVGSRTIHREELDTKLTYSSKPLTGKEIMLAISKFTDVLKDCLSKGESVHVDGLGTFSISLTCDRSATPDNVRAEYVSLKDIVFRPEKSLLNELKNEIRFEKGCYTKYSHKPTASQAIDILKAMMTENGSVRPFTCKEFAAYAHLSNTTAHKLVKEMVANGTICNLGLTHAPLYQAAAAICDEVSQQLQTNN